MKSPCGLALLFLNMHVCRSRFFVEHSTPTFLFPITVIFPKLCSLWGLILCKWHQQDKNKEEHKPYMPIGTRSQVNLQVGSLGPFGSQVFQQLGTLRKVRCPVGQFTRKYDYCKRQSLITRNFVYTLMILSFLKENGENNNKKDSFVKIRTSRS